MSVIHALFVASLLAQAGQPQPSAQACPYGYTLEGVSVREVTDGDTLSVSIGGVPALFGERVGIRLRGLDAPEMHATEPCERRMALRATLRLMKLVTMAKQLRFSCPGRDKYFRIVATVKADGLDAAQVLIDEGLAVPYAGGAKPAVNWCAKEAAITPK